MLYRKSAVIYYRTFSDMNFYTLSEVNQLTSILPNKKEVLLP